MINTALKRRSAFARGIPWMILRKEPDGAPDTSAADRRQSLGFYVFGVVQPPIIKKPRQKCFDTFYFKGPGKKAVTYRCPPGVSNDDDVAVITNAF